MRNNFILDVIKAFREVKLMIEDAVTKITITESHRLGKTVEN